MRDRRLNTPPTTSRLGVWDAVSALSDNMNALGLIIVGVFAAIWIVDLAVFELMGDGRPLRA